MELIIVMTNNGLETFECNKEMNTHVFQKKSLKVWVMMKNLLAIFKISWDRIKLMQYLNVSAHIQWVDWNRVIIQPYRWFITNYIDKLTSGIKFQANTNKYQMNQNTTKKR